MADMTTPNIFTMPQANGNDMGMGAITPLILGAALFGGRGGLFGNNGDGAAAAAAAVERGATVNEVQGIVNGINTMQDIGAVRRDVAQVGKEVWQAEGDLQAAVYQGNGAIQNQVLQAQIAQMQGQANIINSIDSHSNDIEQNIGVLSANVNSQFAVTNASIAASAAAAALAAKDAAIDALRNTQLITATVVADGNVTRAAIADLKDQLPNARELQLQREVGVLEVQLSRQLAAESVRAGNVDVVTNVNQTATQTAQQVQLQNLSGLVNGLYSELQRNTQQTIAIGSTLTGNAQTATNNRVNG
jgi:hypothetical protein